MSLGLHRLLRSTVYPKLIASAPGFWNNRRVGSHKHLNRMARGRALWLWVSGAFRAALLASLWLLSSQ